MANSRLTSKFYSDASGSLKVRVREDGRVWVLDSWSGADWVELQNMDQPWFPLKEVSYREV